MMPTLCVVPSHSLERWDVKHVLVPRWLRPLSQLIPFGQVATRRVEPNTGLTVFGSVHFDGKVTARSVETLIKGKTFVAQPNDLVFSRIDVRNGAVGVIPDDLGPLAFTNEYPVYDLTGKGLLLPGYARLLLRTAIFRSQVGAVVVGHSGRKRVSADAFETIPIPVPPLHEQRSIIDMHEQLMAHAALLREQSLGELRGAVATVSEMLGLRSPDAAPISGPFVIASHRAQRWSVFSATGVVRGITGDLESAYPVEKLGSSDLATVSYGVSKSPKNRPGAHSRPYLRVANVQDGFLDLRVMKYINVPEAQVASFLLEPGDVLLCEGNSAELVGRPAIWSGEIEGCVHQNHILRVRCNKVKLLPEYLLAYMQTIPSRGYFRRQAKQTTNLASINSTDVNGLPVPIPPLPVQRAVAQVWRDARAASEALFLDADDAEQQALSETERLINGV